MWWPSYLCSVLFARAPVFARCFFVYVLVACLQARFARTLLSRLPYVVA